MYISAFFTNLGVPATGLSPTVTVWDLSDDSVDVNAAAMTEVAGGWYKYNFTTYDATKEYSFRCYGGAGLPTVEQYAAGTIDITGASVADAVWNEMETGHTTAGTFGGSLSLIRQVEQGKWTIVGNRMTIYADNGTTPFYSLILQTS